MMVCAHGDVSEYCEQRDMVICDRWEGKPYEYSGPCRVLVTDADMTEHEYYYMKGQLLAKGIELVSTRHSDNPLLSEYLVYANSRRKENRVGRKPFEDEVVIRRIRELRAKGMSIRAIRDAEGVCSPDGRRFSTSTIFRIIKSEEKE